MSHSKGINFLDKCREDENTWSSYQGALSEPDRSRDAFLETLFILDLNRKQEVLGPEWGTRLLGSRKGVCKGPEAERQTRGC